MEEEEGYKEIAKGTFWQFSAFTAVKILGLIFTILMARYFVKEAIGEFYAAFGIISLFTLFTDPGLSNILSVYVSGYYGKKEYNKIRKLVYLIFAIGSIISITFVSFFLVFNREVANAFNSPTIAPLLAIFSIYLLLYSLFIMGQAAILGFKKSKDAAISMTIQTLSRLLLLFPVIFLLGSSSTILSALFVVSFATGTIIHCYYVWLYWKNLPKSEEQVTDKEVLNEVKNFGISAFLAGIINNVLGNSDKIFLAYILGSAGSGQIAIYALALGLATLTQMFSSAIGSIFVPVVSHMHADKEENYEKIVTVTNTSLKWTMLLSLPIFVLLLVYPSEVMSTMYGNGYAIGGMTLVILTIAFMMFTLGYHQRNVLFSIKKADVVTKVTAISLAITIALYLLLIPVYGIIGAALAYMTYYLVNLILTYMESKKLFRFSFYNTNYKIILMGIVLLGLNLGIKILFYDKITAAIIKLPLAGATKFAELGALFAPILIFFIALIFLGRYFTIFTKNEVEIFSQWLKKAKVPDFILSIINKIPTY